jgi:hypothetical protein
MNPTPSRLDRMLASPHFATFLGVLVVFAAACTVVGLAVLLDVIAEAVR